MARFGQGFLQALTQPSYGQGLFELGGAIGGAPAAAAARQKAEEEERKKRGLTSGLLGLEQMAASGQLTPEMYRDAMGSLANLGATPDQVLAVTKAGRERAQTTSQEATRKKLEQNVMAKIRRTVSDEEQQRSLMERYIGASEEDLRSYLAGVKGKDKYSVVGNAVFDNETGKFLTAPQAASKAEELKLGDLEKIFTGSSIQDYLQSGKDVNKLVAKKEDEEAGSEELSGKLSTADTVLGTIKEAANLTENVWPVTYDIAKFAPNTDARSLSNKVDTLKANLSFDRLQKMRDESKTGGALGQVSNIELRLLGSALASLDPASKDFAQQLKKVEDSYSRFKAALLGKKPPGDKYIEDNGILYYVDEDEEGNEEFISLGAM